MVKKSVFFIFSLLLLSACSSEHSKSVSDYDKVTENSDPIRTCGGTVIFRLKKDVNEEFTRGSFWIVAARNSLYAIPPNIVLDQFCKGN